MVVLHYAGEIDDQFLDTCNFLEISLVGIPVDKETIPENKTQYFSVLNLVEGPEVNINTIKKILNKQRFRHEIITVEPHTSGLAAFAARDRRIDCILISKQSSLSVFNTKYSRRLKENNKIAVLDLSSLFFKIKASELRPILRILETFKQAKLPYVLTNEPISITDLRSYRGLQSIGRILGLDNNETDRKNLLKRIHENRLKLDGIKPLQGVELIEW